MVATTGRCGLLALACKYSIILLLVLLLQVKLNTVHYQVLLLPVATRYCSRAAPAKQSFPLYGSYVLVARDLASYHSNIATCMTRTVPLELSIRNVWSSTAKNPTVVQYCTIIVPVQHNVRKCSNFACPGALPAVVFTTSTVGCQKHPWRLFLRRQHRSLQRPSKHGPF